MTLPTGRFWCWVCEATGWVNYTDDERNVGISPNDMRPDLFAHIFGVVPAPGVALMLDATKRAAYCPECDTALIRVESEAFTGCPKCNRHYDVARVHAHILDRKKLE